MEHNTLPIPLPSILAGPILRHTSSTSVTVWFATSIPLDMELHIYSPDNTCLSQAFNDQARQTIIQLGTHLYVTLLTATPIAASFPLDTLLSYDIHLRDTQTLLALDEYCLAGATRPNFYIPSHLTSLAYGSCRKVHGLSFSDAGEIQHRDALGLLADQLEADATNLTTRPALLFLVGDQIYADDVLPELIAFVQTLAPQLMGQSIPLPEAGCVSYITDQRRQQIKEACHLTSTSEHGHVLSFGEYAALYLVTLGNQVGFDYSFTPDPPLPAQFESRHEADYERLSMHDFVRSQAAVRKVLANIPTYLSFDDHDITDDWNLCRSWYDDVRSSQDGTRVIANGLAAYWAFQAWGNNPEEYASPNAQHLINVIQAHLLDTTHNATKAAAFDFHLWKWRRWSFVLPTQPPIFVLDSRTQRDFGKNNEPPQLMDRYALDWLRGEWLKLRETQQVTDSRSVTPLFFTGTPVFGFSSIEWAQYALYRLGILLGNFYPRISASRLDMESWIANRRGFSFLLDTLLRQMGLSSATFLSGDVHYSFVNRALYVDYSQATDKQLLRCLQLTSSAVRNTPPSWRMLETFFANWAIKSKSGYCRPETLPWWERVFLWRLFRLDVWQVVMRGVFGCELGEKKHHPSHWQYWLFWRKLTVTRGRLHLNTEMNWITSRPNIAIVALKKGKVVSQTLLSGDNRDNNLAFYIHQHHDQHPNET